MTNLWMPGADVHSLGNTGGMNGGPPRAVWHITSNANDWTFARQRSYFTGSGRTVAPHLLWDPFTGQIAQFFPADSRSLSLANYGIVKINRSGKYCIQVETVFTAGETVNGRRYNTVRDTPCKGLPRIVAWLRSLGIPDAWPGGAPKAFARDTVPLNDWLTHGGHYGHNQIPGNSHVDPGPMPNLFADKPAPPAFPGRQFFVLGAENDHALTLQRWLDKGNWGPAYRIGPSRRMTELDLQKVRALQAHYVSALGPADGLCGPKTWQYAYEVATGQRKR